MVERQFSRRSLLKSGGGMAVALAVTPLLQACGAPTAAGGGSVTLKMSSSMTDQPGNAHSEWFNKFSALLKEKAGDAVGVRYFPNSQLGDEAKIVQQIKLGAVDMMISGSSIWSQVVPDFGVLDMGYIFDSWDAVGRALDGRAGDLLSAKLKSKGGAQVIGWAYNFGARNLLTKKPVNGPMDLHGVKIRTLQSAQVIETVNLMGAVATPLPTTQVYTSLQTSLIEGLEHDAPTILQNKWYEAVNSLALTQHIFNPLAVVIGTAALDRIPTKHRDGFLAAAKEASTYQRTQAIIAEQKAMDALKSKNVTVHNVDTKLFSSRVKPLWDTFTAKNPDSKPILQQIVGG